MINKVLLYIIKIFWICFINLFLLFIPILYIFEWLEYWIYKIKKYFVDGANK